jgi:glycine/D-amino acid oxidase-like deaminating enzyme
MADVVVIGGVILGAATALHLADAGTGGVVLLERPDRSGAGPRARAPRVGRFAGLTDVVLAAGDA